MTAATSSNLANILKDVWTQDDLEGLFFKSFPLYARMNRETNWDGDARPIAVEYAQVGGIANTFNAALVNRGPTSVNEMMVRTSDVYAIWSVEHKLMKLSRNNAGAIVKAVKDQSESAMRSLKFKVAWQLYGNGGGAIGQIATAGISTNTIQLTNISDSRKFEKNYVIRSSTTDGSSGAPNTGSLVVSNVNRRTGVITFTVNVTAGIPAAAAADYLFIDGDFGAAFKGLPYYIPATSALVTGSTAWGMDRTPDPLRLGGIRIGGQGRSTEEAVSDALRVCNDEGADEIDCIFMNTLRWQDFSLSLDTRREFMKETVGSVGFSGLKVMAPNGREVACYGDANCDPNDIWLLNMNDLKFASAGEFPDFLTWDGGPITEATANAGQFRSGGYAQFYPEHPGYHGRLMMNVSPTATTI